MKLIKLAYISHGWNLAFYDNPLISELVQAWKYGPVVESIYHGFKRYGDDEISKSELACLQNFPESFVANGVPLLEKVWEKYGAMSGLQLSSLTHQPGTPWDIVWNQGNGKNQIGAVISNDLIRGFYRKKLETKTGSGH